MVLKAFYELRLLGSYYVYVKTPFFFFNLGTAMDGSPRNTQIIG